MEKKKSNSIVKYNEQVHISNGMSFLARKCWNILLGKLVNEILQHKNKYQNSIYNYMETHGIKFEEIKDVEQLKNMCINEMKVIELMNALEISTHNQEYLKKVLKGLMSTTIEFNILDQEGKVKWGATTLLSSCEIKEGVIKYEFSNYLMNKMLLANQYTRIKLSIQKKMTNKYSLALYENCLKWHNKNLAISFSPKISIKDLRKLLIGDETKYLNFKEFNRYIIKKAISQINKVSDLDISKKDYKELKEVTHIQFIIKKKVAFDKDKAINYINQARNTLTKEYHVPVKSLDDLKDTLEQKGILKKAQNEPLENNLE